VQKTGVVTAACPQDIRTLAIMNGSPKLDKQSPSDLFGSLFSDVQAMRIYADSKSFADAVPFRAPAEILADWKDESPVGPLAVKSFVESNFLLPVQDARTSSPKVGFEQYLRESWSSLTRDHSDFGANSSALMLPRPFVVPGGRFREFYYWDSYFSMLGLVECGRQDLVEDMIENFGSLLDRYGLIPNASRTYYLSRSHPPVFYLAAALSKDHSLEARQRRLDWMIKEHCFWMDGAEKIEPGKTYRRLVCLHNGMLLNRYWDDKPQPRDESWYEDVELAGGLPENEQAELWRNLRAAAESGWDFSSRWLSDRQSLASIRTTHILPIDLNALLFGLEQAIANEAGALGDEEHRLTFDQKAKKREYAINTYLWNAQQGHYSDYLLDTEQISAQLTSAAFFPLFVGVCSHQQAQKSINALSNLLAPGGLLATERNSNQQWDAPNGWAPLQWIAFEALRKYGKMDLAHEIARRWLRLVEQHFLKTGQIMEKYDVVSGEAGGGGEYPVEIGFGWTNGVSLAFLKTLKSKLG
jgi:alpha,alpha-trehalase